MNTHAHPGYALKVLRFVLQIAIEQSQEYNKPLWLLSMDMRKAFDIVEHSAVLQALKKHGVHDSYCELISALYSAKHLPFNVGSNREMF